MTTPLRRSLAVALVLAGLLLGPLEARIDVPRELGADVVDDGQAFVAVAALAPTLNGTNSYQDEAMTITHQHVSGTDLGISVTTDSSRFEVVDASTTLSTGQSHTTSVKDTDLLHTTGTFSLELTVTGDLQEGAASIGAQTVVRTITVTVE